MSVIHLNRDRVSLGQFSADDVAEGLASGRFLPTDLGWREGMDSWLPLSQFTDLPAVAREAVPAGPSIAPGVELLDATHRGGIQPEWEGDHSGGVVARAIATIREVLSNPSTTFSRLSQDKNFLPSLWFAMLVGTVTNGVAVGYQVAFTMVNPEASGIPKETLESPWFGGAMAFAVLLLPVFIALVIFIMAGLYHVGMMLTGSAKSGFRSTFRVAAYVQGATSVLLLIPLCGQLIQFVWIIILMVIGLQKAHQSSTSAAVIGALVPVVLSCGFFLAIYMLIVGAAVAAGGGLPAVR